MNRSMYRLAAPVAGIRTRDILGVVAGLIGLAVLSMLNVAGAVTSGAPANPGPIAARLTTSASALTNRPAAGPAASPVEFKLWAQSNLGPLNLIVVSHSDSAAGSQPAAVIRTSSAR